VGVRGSVHDGVGAGTPVRPLRRHRRLDVGPATAAPLSRLLLPLCDVIVGMSGWYNGVTKSYYASALGGRALSDTAIRPYVCPMAQLP